MEREPKWKEKTMIADLYHLLQKGLVFKLFFVFGVILGRVRFVARLATKMPIYYCWSHMNQVVNANFV